MSVADILHEAPSLPGSIPSLGETMGQWVLEEVLEWLGRGRGLSVTCGWLFVQSLGKAMWCDGEVQVGILGRGERMAG